MRLVITSSEIGPPGDCQLRSTRAHKGSQACGDPSPGYSRVPLTQYFVSGSLRPLPTIGLLRLPRFIECFLREILVKYLIGYRFAHTTCSSILVAAIVAVMSRALTLRSFNNLPVHMLFFPHTQVLIWDSCVFWCYVGFPDHQEVPYYLVPAFNFVLTLCLKISGGAYYRGNGQCAQLRLPCSMQVSPQGIQYIRPASTRQLAVAETIFVSLITQISTSLVNTFL